MEFPSKMLLNVFFHTKWYYVNNCPLKWAFGRFFPWLLMRWLSPCILIWKIQVSYYRCCSYLENSRPLAVALHIRRKGVLCVGQLWMRFFRNHSWTFVSFSLKTASFLLSRQKSTFSVRTPHCTQSYLLSTANASLATQFKAAFFFPVTPSCSQRSD